MHEGMVTQMGVCQLWKLEMSTEVEGKGRSLLRGRCGRVPPSSIHGSLPPLLRYKRQYVLLNSLVFSSHSKLQFMNN